MDDVPYRTTLPNWAISWINPNNHVAYKDIRIWLQTLPVSFLYQARLKELDGSYYPNLFYYQPLRGH